MHIFEFEVNDAFFEAMEYSIIHKGNVKAGLELDKRETMMIARFWVDGVVSADCDRCNTPLDLAIAGEYKLVYKFGTEESEDESLVVLHPDDYELDVTNALYELITVSLPMRILHAPGECDEEMWALLQQYTINPGPDEDDDDDDWDEDDEDFDDEDFDDEDDDSDDDDDKGPIDPKWSVLKNLN
jgi:uncharacterized protein